mgnify:FL=1
MSTKTYGQKTVGMIAIGTFFFILFLTIVATLAFTHGCSSGVTTFSTPDPCLAAGIDPTEQQGIMDGMTRDSLYFSYGEERQSAIDACWTGSVSSYQADNCVACVIPLINFVYSR